MRRTTEEDIKKTSVSNLYKKELEEKAKNGDKEAFVELLEIYRPRLEGMAYRYCKNTHGSEDLVSSAYERAWRFFDKFEGGSTVWTWVYRITINVCKNQLQLDKRNPYNTNSCNDFNECEDDELRVGQEFLPIEDPSEAVAAMRSREKLERAFNRLPVKHQEILELFEQKGLKYKEISETMGIPIGTVQSRLYNAREKLAKALDDYER